MHVVVTGASSGIGAALAREFGKEAGSTLTLVARRKTAMEDLANEIAAKHNVIAHDRVGVVVEEARARRNAGVVHEQVNARMPVEDACRDRLDRGPVGDVAELVLAVGLGRERAEPVFPPRQEGAMPAVSGERAGKLGSDARRRPRDDRDALLYLRHTLTIRRSETE